MQTSTGSSFAILHELGDHGFPGAYLARVVETRTAAIPPVVLLETFPDARAADAVFDMLLEEDLWLPRQLRAPEFIRVYESGRMLEALSPGARRGPYRSAAAGEPYVALEPVQGVSLAALLDAGRTLNRCLAPGAAVTVAAAVARGLAYLHGLRSAGGVPLGAVLRGLAPSHVFLSIDGLVRLLPPIAPWIASPPGGGLARAKLGYIAPELIRGEAPTPRSDLFALGAMLWEALAGRRLFHEKTDQDTIHAVLNDRPPSLSEARAEVSRPLEELVAALLHKAPGARPGTADEVARALGEIRRTLDVEPSAELVAEHWSREAGAAQAASWATFACIRTAAIGSYQLGSSE